MALTVYSGGLLVRDGLLSADPSCCCCGHACGTECSLRLQLGPLDIYPLLEAPYGRTYIGPYVSRPIAYAGPPSQPAINYVHTTQGFQWADATLFSDVLATEALDAGWTGDVTVFSVGRQASIANPCPLFDPNCAWASGYYATTAHISVALVCSNSYEFTGITCESCERLSPYIGPDITVTPSASNHHYLLATVHTTNSIRTQPAGVWPPYITQEQRWHRYLYELPTAECVQHGSSGGGRDYIDAAFSVSFDYATGEMVVNAAAVPAYATYLYRSPAFSTANTCPDVADTYAGFPCASATALDLIPFSLAATPVQTCRVCKDGEIPCAEGLECCNNECSSEGCWWCRYGEHPDYDPICSQIPPVANAWDVGPFATEQQCLQFCSHDGLLGDNPLP